MENQSKYPHVCILIGLDRICAQTAQKPHLKIDTHTSTNTKQKRDKDEAKEGQTLRGLVVAASSVLHMKWQKREDGFKCKIIHDV